MSGECLTRRGRFDILKSRTHPYGEKGYLRHMVARYMLSYCSFGNVSECAKVDKIKIVVQYKGAVND